MASRKARRLGLECWGWLGSGREASDARPADRDAGDSWNARMMGSWDADWAAVGARIHSWEPLGCREEVGRAGCAA